MSKPLYRHRSCDAFLQTGLTRSACIGCGGDFIYPDMDVPESRRDTSIAANRRWLLRNLGVRNSHHELYEFTINKIKELNT